MTKNDKMKWKIAVDWEVFGEVEIEADTLEEAISIGNRDDPPIALPESNYIDGSWKVNDEMSKVLNEDELKNIKYRGGRRYQLNPYIPNEKE